MEYAMGVKGLEILKGEPRGMVGYGLTYAVSDRGADHLLFFLKIMKQFIMKPRISRENRVYIYGMKKMRTFPQKKGSIGL